MTTTPTTFIRLLAADDKAAALRAAIAAHDAGAADAPTPTVFTVDPASFRQVPGAPFAYWVSDRVLQMFTESPPFESEGTTVKQGLSTDSDFRFVRIWWEYSPELSVSNRHWMPFAKGGVYSPFYSDVHLSLNWANDGEELKASVAEKTKQSFGKAGWSRWINSVDYYFRPGLTYPRRTQGGFSVRVMPAGCIFADKGPAMFVNGDADTDLLALLAVVNSAPFRELLSLQMAFGSYEVGVVQRTPVPTLGDDDTRALAALAREAHDRKREADRDDEVTHPFTSPALLRLTVSSAPAEVVGPQLTYPSLAAAFGALLIEDAARDQRLATIQREVDDICFRLYGFAPADRAEIEDAAGGVPPASEATIDANTQGDAASADYETDSSETRDADEGAGEDTKDERPVGKQRALRDEVANLLMYAVGCAFGRWDARIGRDPSLAPALADPFAPLPVCAPGTLVGPDGLPARKDTIASEAWLRARPNAITLPETGNVAGPATISAEDYLLPVAWDGILVDDPDASNDIVHCVRAALDAVYGADGRLAGALELEACSLLGVRDLREYFRNPRLFFDYHISHYSKSRRKAPIYWLLQSSRRNYGIWLSYHRLDADLIFKSINFHLLPRLRLEEQRLDELTAAKQQAGPSGPEARRVAQALDHQQTLLGELRDFHDALDRAARLYLTPDLNDGVLLNVAPYHEVVSWRKEAKAAWEQLLAGTYAWSSIGRQLRDKGLVKAR